MISLLVLLVASTVAPVIGAPAPYEKYSAQLEQAKELEKKWSRVLETNYQRDKPIRGKIGAPALFEKYRAELEQVRELWKKWSGILAANYPWSKPLLSTIAKIFNIPGKRIKRNPSDKKHNTAGNKRYQQILSKLFSYVSPKNKFKHRSHTDVQHSRNRRDTYPYGTRSSSGSSGGTVVVHGGTTKRYPGGSRTIINVYGG